MIKRTERDILRAYRVYKAGALIRERITEEDCDYNTYIVIVAFVALYNGITPQELHKVLPIKNQVIKDMVRKCVYKYGILDFDGSVVIGHRSFLDKGCKGVLTIARPLQEAINAATKTLRVSRRMLRAFASVLSNSAAHTIILRDNLQHVDSKGVLARMYAFWLALLDGSLYSGSAYAKDLTKLGYMRDNLNGNVILNKEAVFYNKEPDFELSTICKSN